MSSLAARVASLDALFHFDEATATHAHLGSCAVFAGPAPSLPELAEAVRGSLNAGDLARYQQLGRFVPGGSPIWVDDPAFALVDHLRELSLPAPCGDGELDALMSDLMIDELPSDQPPWAMRLVDGMGDGRWAIVSKVHPCIVDASEGPDLLARLLGVGDLWSFGRLHSPFTPHPPARSWSRSVGSTPRWAAARCGIDETQAIADALGATVHEVILAAVAGAFGGLLMRNGAAESMRFSALVPAPHRHSASSDEPVPMMIVELPVDIVDPLRRLKTVEARIRRVEGPQHMTRGNGFSNGSVHANDIVPAGQFGWAEQIAHGKRWVPQRPVSTVVTNVGAPGQPAFAMGREMLAYTPFVPIADGLRLGVALTTYNGLCTVGITGDDASADAVSFFAACVESALRDLRHLVLPIERG